MVGHEFKGNRLDQVIDVHIHPIRALASENKLIHQMDDAGISKAVILGLDLDKSVIDNEESLREEIISDLLSYSIFIDPYRMLSSMKQILRWGNTSNSMIAELTEKYPNRFIGFGSVNPRKNLKYIKKKLQEIHELNLQGIKLIPTLQFFKPQRRFKDRFNLWQRRIIDNLDLIFKFAKKKDIPILIHPGKDPGPWEIHTMRYVQGSHPKFWRPYLRRFRNNKLIFAHLGCYGCDIYDDSWFEEVIYLANHHPNVYLDTSAVTYYLKNSNVVERIRETCGFNKILFGSDSPVVQGMSMKENIQIIENSPFLSENERASILYENAKNLLSIR